MQTDTNTRHSTQSLAVTTMTTAALLLVGGASLAMGQAGAVDADGDGMVSFSEMLVVMPDLTEEEFLALDADADGLLGPDEVAAAQEAGLVPAG